MEKKKYEKPEINILQLEVEDVITASNGFGGFGGNNETTIITPNGLNP